MKIYSMPEGFLTDQEVPVRWRILGILNGFHINGKDLYASNDWLARQLDCSERSISNGVKELETRGEIYCERTKTSRIIKRTLIDDSQEEGSKRLLPPLQTASIPDSKRLLPISLSNADNKMLGVAIAPRITYSEESENTNPKKKKDTNITKEYKELCQWLSNARGFPFVSLGKQYEWLSIAREAQISKTRLKERANEQLGDSFYQDKGVDWGTVVSSFNRKS